MKRKKPFSIYNLRRFGWMLLPMLVIFVYSIENISAAGPLNVYVVNYPLKYFAERIGGEYVKVTFPAPPDVDPAYWNPSVADISAYQTADLILINGAGYAKWVNKVSLPRSRMVDTSKRFKDQYITTKDVTTHSHGAEGKHAHESLAFTTWLDPKLAALQAEAVSKALCRKRPELKDVFSGNLKSLRKDLMALDQEIEAIVKKTPSTPLIASHPVYDYLARRYGLNLESVHWEPDEVPGNEQWQALKILLKHHPAKWMIWEGTPVKKSADRLKAMGVKSLVFDPCGNVPGKGDFLTVMRSNVENLKSPFKQASTHP